MLSSLNQLMLKRPRLASGVAGGFLGGCGDLAAQQLERLYQPDSASTRRSLEPSRAPRSSARSTAARPRGFYFPFYAWMDVAFRRSGWRAVPEKGLRRQFRRATVRDPDVLRVHSRARDRGRPRPSRDCARDFVPTLLAGWLL